VLASLVSDAGARIAPQNNTHRRGAESAGKTVEELKVQSQKLTTADIENSERKKGG
jgi:hypothetical protein